MGLNFFPEKKEKISNALSMAEQIVGNEPINDINSAVNLLKKNGVSPEFLDNVEKMAEHPVAKTLFSFAGMNKENCEVKVNNNKLIVEVGKIQTKPIIEQPKEESKSVFKKKNKSNVKAEVEAEAAEENIRKEYLVNQIAQRHAIMNWTLGNNIDKKRISVEFENGILKSYLVDKHNSKKMNHPINEFFKTSSNSLKDMANVNMIIGQSLDLENGVYPEAV